MRVRRTFTVVAVLALATGVALAGARTTNAGSLGTAAHVYTLRLGDKVSIPAIGQVCSVSAEGGAVDLLCERPRGAHHQVTIFRDNILVWKVGNPDHPLWSGKP